MELPWRVPLMQAPIGSAATTELVAAVSGCGALGTLAASWTPLAPLREQVSWLRSVGDISAMAMYAGTFVQAIDRGEPATHIVERITRGL